MTEKQQIILKSLPEPLIASKPATEHTIRKNKIILEELPFEDRQSFEDARRGFIASISPLTIKRPADGKTTYDLSNLSFLSGEAPLTVNPSLWRQAQLNALHHGLFEVIDGIYQVRSFDVGHMTLVRGQTGWIVIDPLTSAESAKAALDLAFEHLGNRPVVAVIHTHSHVDHFAGILPSTIVCFDIIAKENDFVPRKNVPQFYTADINVIGNWVTVLDTRIVYFLIPPDVIIEGPF